MSYLIRTNRRFMRRPNYSYYYRAGPNIYSRAVQQRYSNIKSSGPIYKPRVQKTTTFKIRGSFGMTSDGGGAISGVFSNDPSGYTDWSNLSNLYDTYKVTGIKLHYIPSLPNDTSTVTGFWPLYVAVDQNDASAVSAVSSLLDYDNLKVYNMYRPWKRYFRLYNQSAISGNTILSGGYRPILTTTATAGVKYYGNGFDLSTSYGQIIVTLYIKGKNRR